MARQPENVTPPGKRWPARLFAARAAKLLAGAVGVGTIIAVVYVALQLPFFQTNASQAPGDNDPRIGLVEPNAHVNPLDTLEQTTPDATGSGDGGPDDPPDDPLTVPTDFFPDTPNPATATATLTATPTPTETLEPTNTPEPTRTPTETQTPEVPQLTDDQIHQLCTDYLNGSYVLQNTDSTILLLGLNPDSLPDNPTCKVLLRSHSRMDPVDIEQLSSFIITIAPGQDFDVLALKAGNSADGVIDGALSPYGKEINSWSIWTLNLPIIRRRYNQGMYRFPDETVKVALRQPITEGSFQIVIKP